ncbi:NADH:flavin oxidoreductase [Caulobacter sp. AP07]|nr:NADH:flavin oxidoreductase [Caulobacter sp. AP07]
MSQMQPLSPLFTPLTLPNGAVVPNRLAKAAMEENMADDDHLPGAALLALYAAWAKGGVGLILTGNVMVDPTALTGPGGVVLDAHQPLEPFRAWAKTARAGGAQVWMQINHPGRQVQAAMGQEAVGPSAVALDLAKYSKLFATPRALEPAEIAAVVERFAVAAERAEQAGFTGVQVHAAHGYLLSQFLSPLSNHRTDAWGGSLENRARLLLDVVRAVRARVSPGFCVGVKLNSADFQKGGFEAADATVVVGWLNDLGVDLVELSGGSYESPAMQGEAKSSTLAREAYFIDFAREIGGAARMPVMVTGGVRRLAVAQQALEPKDGRDGVDLVGLARAMAFAPDLPARWRRGQAHDVVLPIVAWKNKVMASLADMAVTKVQLSRLGAGKAPKASVSPLLSLIGQQLWTKGRTKRYRAWLARRAA